jgi:hypothetical protein
MQLTFNKFKQIVDKSSEKVFGKIAEAIAGSDNAALVSLYDDKLILLDEERDNFYSADYSYQNGVLSMKNFEPISLIENDSSYLDQVVGQFFDLDDDKPVTIGEMMTGVNLRFKNNSNQIINEAKDRKYRKIQESPRIRAIKKVRKVRDLFAEDIKKLMEEDFMGQLKLRVDGDAKNSVPSAINRVKWETPYTVHVNTEQGRPVNMIKIKDNTSVIDAMADVASHLSDKWKSDSFRNKFEKMVKEILATESIELARTAVLNFLDENKELFLLKKDLFEELITKTTLMAGEGDSDTVVKIFNNIVESKAGRMMKRKFFKDNSLTEEKIAEINRLAEEEDALSIPEPKEEGGDKEKSSDLDAPKDDESSSDLDSEEVNKIIDIFKKIAKQLESDSPEADYVQGLISSLDSAKVKGIEDSKMKEIIDFLSAAKNEKKDSKDDEDEDGDEEDSKDDDDEDSEEVEI